MIGSRRPTMIAFVAALLGIGFLMPIVSSAALTPAWTTATYMQSGSILGAPDVSACVSESFCMSSRGAAFDGTSWSQTAGSSLITVNNHVVACGSATSCVEVELPGQTQFKGAVWDGTSWSSLPLPNPFPQFATINGISCGSATFCVAVGDGINGQLHNIIEMWDGLSWSVASVPADPAGDGQLLDVSCPSARFCMAVGDNGANAADAYTWDGVRWTETNATTSPASVLFDFVSCVSATMCEAVNDYNPPLAFAGWDGSSWTYQKSQGITGATSFLGDISCASATVCAAVGNISTNVTDSVPVAELFNGTAWTKVTLPSSVKGSQLDSVACFAGGHCQAYGTAASFSTAPYPLVVSNFLPTALKTSIHVKASPATVEYGHSTTITATLGASDGNGVVSFKQSNQFDAVAGCEAVPVVKVAGTYTATCTTSALSQGDYAISATYSGSPKYAPIGAAATVSVFSSVSGGTFTVHDAPTYKAMSATLQAQGFVITKPFVWTVQDPLPAGLKLSTTGVLSGTPTVAGNYHFNVLVSDSAKPPRRTLTTIALKVTPLTYTGQIYLSADVARTFTNAQLTATGGKGTLTFTAAPGSLPPGVTLSHSGVWGGAPTVPGSYSIPLTVTDSLLPTHQVATATISFLVNPMTLGSFGVAAGAVGKYFQHAPVPVFGGKAQGFIWSIAAGSLPPGLKLNTSGSITGTPTTAGTYDFTIRATDKSVPPNTATTMGTIVISS